MSTLLLVALVLSTLPAHAASETKISPYYGHAPSPLFGAAICLTENRGFPAGGGWGCASTRIRAGQTQVSIDVLDMSRRSVAFSYGFDVIGTSVLVCGASEAGPIAVPPGKDEILVVFPPDDYCRDGTPTATGGVVVFTLS